MTATPVDFSVIPTSHLNALGVDGDDHLVWLGAGMKLNWSKLQ